MSKLRITLACSNYDRTHALLDGRVQPDGIDLNYLSLPVEETFFRMARFREFDIAEMSLSSYTVSLNSDAKPFIAIPVFPSRFFRHSCIYINRKAGIREPKDLIGKRVGTPEYQMTAPVWIRGILADEYDVPLDSVTYLTGGQEAPGRIEKGAISTRFEVTPIPPDRTLNEMLHAGEIDAFYGPRIPSSFGRGDGRVRRLFPDMVSAEKDYYASTGIFPIMHVVAVRREVYERYPWVAQSLTKALDIAKNQAYDRIYDASALRFMEPWLMPHLEEARGLLGQDYWSYGLEANRHVLDVFCRYHHDQGLSSRPRTADELFAPEATESFVI